MIQVLKYLKIYLCLLCFTPLTACDDDTESKPDLEEIPTLSVDVTRLDFDANGGTQDLSISSNAIWKLNFDADAWAKASLQSTRGDATVKVTADANPTTSERELLFTLTADGAESIQITVAQEAGTEDEEPIVTDIPDYVDPDNTGMRDITSFQLAKEMGLGWNLGNSLEAILVNNGQLSGNETSWGNAYVTRKLIDGIKSAGFNTIRIPVSWSHKFDDEETYQINHQWMLRVEEVVNYALENDMYVMMNIHWDGGWMNQPYYDRSEEINNRLAVMWKQIAKFFRHYDDRLLFAGTNEVHVAGDYGQPSVENTEVQNSFNQTFVNTVRATGGQNAYRHLVVQSYNTNIALAVNFMEIPTDEIEDRLMVEVHYYDPYQFTLDESSNKYLWGEEFKGHAGHSDWGDEDWVHATFGDVKTHFVDKGYPVILGEYCALLRANLPAAAQELHLQSRNYYHHYITKTAIAYGMVPVYWDNGHTGNNGSGLFNRANGTVVHEEALAAIISAQN